MLIRWRSSHDSRSSSMHSSISSSTSCPSGSVPTFCATTSLCTMSLNRPRPSQWHISELLPPSVSVSNTPLYFESILTWTVNNDMQINISKTKEIILGRISQNNLELLSTPAGTVERVTTFKLLGIHLDDTLTWSTHVNAITSKATKRLYFLKQLTRAGVPCQELLHFYTAVIPSCP